MAAFAMVSTAAELTRALAQLLGLELLYSTVLCGVVAGLAWVLRRRSPRLLYALWGLVLLRLVLPPALALPFSARSLVERALGTGWASSLTGLPGTEGLSEVSPEQAHRLAPEASREPASWVWLLLLPGWAVGASWVASALLRQRRQCRRLLGRAHPVEEARVLALLHQWRERLGIRREVRLLTSDAPLSPLTLGSFRPVIFLPEAVLRHPEPSMVESVLAHELAHVRRWDDARLLMQRVLQVIYFFHPVVWLATSRMGAECERLCDGMVLTRGAISPRAYGRSLLEVLSLPLEGPEGVLAFEHPKRRYAMRIRHILESRPGRHPVHSFLSLSAAVLVGVLLLPMASGGEEPETAAAREFRNPLPGSRVTSRYGEQVDPFTGQPRHHRGIDVAAKAGSRVLAPAAGRVEVATSRYEGGEAYGIVVILDHGGGVKTFYAHLGERLVEPGQQVEAGAILGTQGATGKATGPHLHFEVWAQGEAVDPGQYVAEWRQR